jgi:hypothetical protein
MTDDQEALAALIEAREIMDAAAVPMDGRHFWPPLSDDECREFLAAWGRLDEGKK